MTFNEFASPFLAFCEVFNRTFSDDGIDMWFRSFSDLPVAEFQVAIARFIREAKSGTFPTPGEIRKLCPSGMADEDRSLVAWNAAVKASRCYGFDATVDFSDRIINAVIRQMGGWEEFRDWDASERKWKEREFRAKYEHIARTGSGDGSPLIGFIDRTNIANGHERREPITRIAVRLSQHPMAATLEYTNTVQRLGISSPAVALIGEMPKEKAG